MGGGMRGAGAVGRYWSDSPRTAIYKSPCIGDSLSASAVDRDNDPSGILKLTRGPDVASVREAHGEAYALRSASEAREAAGLGAGPETP
jgi:hypothetical protein